MKTLASMLLILMGAGMASATDTPANFTPEMAAPVPDTAASAPTSDVAAPASEAMADAPQATTDNLTAIPKDATVRSGEAHVAYFIRAKASVPGDLTVFRTSLNMPELSTAFLADQITEKTTTDFLGYMPKLKITHCDECNGRAFNRVMERFLKGYASYGTGDGKVEYRGVMPIHIRFFDMASMLNPMGTSAFGVSFVYEGKLITLGRQVGGKDAIYSHAEALGERLAHEVLMRIGAGLRPQSLVYLDNKDSNSRQVTLALGKTLTGLNVLTGGIDARSRVEPVDMEKFGHLMPAIDGIKPGEVRPVAEMIYIPNI